MAHVLDGFDLGGQVAIVTGGGSGLGRAIAIGLSQLGASVAVVGRRIEPLRETLQALPDDAVGVAVARDIREDEAPAQVVGGVMDDLGPPDVLINAAGVTLVRPSLEMTAADWDRVMSTNLKAAYFLSVEVARAMIERQRGAIVHISSIAALRGGPGGMAAYTASKGGLASLTRSMASEWARHGVRVNAIAAGPFRTKMTARIYEDPKLHEQYRRRIPLRRTGEPHEIAPLAAYLSSSASDYMTGQVITLDGGQTMR